MRRLARPEQAGSLHLQAEQVGPEADQGEAQGQAGAERHQYAGKRSDQEVFGEVPVLFKFIGAHDSLGGDEKGERAWQIPS